MEHTHSTKQARPGWSIESRIETAIERATKRDRYAQYVGYSERLRAYVYYVKSSDPARSGVSGYSVYVYTDPSHGGYRYDRQANLWAKCECRAAEVHKPCIHGAKAARAAARLVRVSLSRRVDPLTGEIVGVHASWRCPRCGHACRASEVYCQTCGQYPEAAALNEPALEDYELSALFVA